VRKALPAIACALASACGQRPEVPAAPVQATVPLQVESHRPIIAVELRRPDGSTRAARFLVDSGGGSFLIVEPLARELGLVWGKTEREEGLEFGHVSVPPVASLGGLALDLDPERVAVIVGADSVLPPQAQARAEGMFPGHLLARYHVVFDYPQRTFTLARPGVLQPSGTPLPMPVSKKSGFPRTELEVDGTTYGFLIDTGASFSMVSEVLLKSWGGAHPDWPRQAGAAGEAATLGGQALETLTLPGARWGTRALGEFGVVSQRAGTFENWMSSMMSAPVVGSLAGNVLEHFRIELDYPNQTLYVSAAAGIGK
jgi:predicted aspartyl protease